MDYGVRFSIYSNLSKYIFYEHKNNGCKYNLLVILFKQSWRLIRLISVINYSRIYN